MSSAELLREPSLFDPVLTRLVADGREYFGSDAITVEAVRRMDRPFSTLLQVRVSAGSTTQGAFIKILKPRADTPAQIASMQQNVRKDFEMTTRVREALAGSAGLMAVRPIACFPSQLAIVTGEVPGPTLSQVLTRDAAGWPRAANRRTLARTLALVGGWLKAAQATLSADGAIDLDRFRVYLNRRLDELAATGAIRLTSSGRAAVERYRDGLIAGISPASLRPVWIHADFCPDNIITRDGQVTVLDFMMATTGTRYHDLAHLFMHLDLMTVKPWFRSTVIDECQAELLAAFEPGLTVDRPLFALVLLQHVICHLVALQAVPAGRAARWYSAQLHRRHRHWLARVAGVGDEGWTR